MGPSPVKDLQYENKNASSLSFSRGSLKEPNLSWMTIFQFSPSMMETQLSFSCVY